ncbi:unnamed protein product, partial [Chrysoparadoxa australica]
RYHPDKVKDKLDGPEKNAGVGQMFRRIQEAWETLRDPVLREEYDKKLDELARPCVISERVQLSSMSRDEVDGEEELLYTYPCRCGELYEVSDEELREGFDVVSCGGCSLHIQVAMEG